LEEHKPIAIHKREWSRTESIERIASRFFIVGEESAGRYSWVVEARSGFSNNDAITLLNNELRELGLVGSLDPRDPPVLSVTERRYGSGILPSWQLGSVWAFSIIMMVFAGGEWAESVGLEGNPYAQSSLFYALPITATLLLASELKRRLNRKAGIESGHLIPLAMPQISPMWWPFGIFGLFGQKSAEHTHVVNRKELAKIEISVPATLFLVGQPMFLVGLLMTPSTPPLELSSAPLAYHGSILPNLFSSLMIDSDHMIRLQWIHPLGLAGLSLSIMGWILMLPIPGLPGDRILSAILGRERHVEMTTQNILFVLSLGVLIAVFVSSDFIPWLVIATIACMRRFGNDQLKPPMIINLSDGFPRESLERYSAAAVMILLLGLPGMSPASEYENWDAGLDPNLWPSSIEVYGEENFDIILSPLGVLELSGEIHFEIDDPSNSGWMLQDSNGEAIEELTFENVMQSNTVTLPLLLSANNSENTTIHPARLILTVDDGVSVTQHPILISSQSGSSPISSSWILDQNSTSACLDIQTSMGENGVWSVDHPFWVSEEKRLEEGVVSSYCIKPQSGGLEGSQRDERGRAMAPPVKFTPDIDPENLTKSWTLPIKGSEAWISISDNTIKLPSWIAKPNSTIIYGKDTLEPSCVLTDSMPTYQNQGDDMDWNINTASLILPPNPGKINLTVPSGGWLTVCDGRIILESLRVRDGPDVQLSSSAMGISITEEKVVIANLGNQTVPLSRDWSGDAPSLDVWSVDAPDQLISNQTAELTVSFDGQEELSGFFWISTNQNSVILNFAARCPSGGCSS
tara:strand:+ start:8312 stop:10723 length:2412 start_codon:yes stop_codon:yes gene_type:complete